MGSIMGRIGPYFACWFVLNIFEERNGINHGNNRSNAEQGPLGSWTAIDKSTLHCNAQCAFWVLRWPCGQKLKSKNTLSDGKKIFLRLFFLCCFRKKTLKLVSLFIFRH